MLNIDPNKEYKVEGIAMIAFKDLLNLAEPFIGRGTEERTALDSCASHFRGFLKDNGLDKSRDFNKGQIDALDDLRQYIVDMGPQPNRMHDVCQIKSHLEMQISQLKGVLSYD